MKQTLSVISPQLNFMFEPIRHVWLWDYTTPTEISHVNISRKKFSVQLKETYGENVSHFINPDFQVTEKIQTKLLIYPLGTTNCTFSKRSLTSNIYISLSSSKKAHNLAWVVLLARGSRTIAQTQRENRGFFAKKPRLGFFDLFQLGFFKLFK